MYQYDFECKGFDSKFQGFDKKPNLKQSFDLFENFLEHLGSGSGNGSRSGNGSSSGSSSHGGVIAYYDGNKMFYSPQQFTKVNTAKSTASYVYYFNGV